MDVIGVAGRGRVAAMQDFVADTGTGAMIHLVDGDGSLWRRFGVFGQPSFAFVSRDGTVRTLPRGLSEEKLRQAAAELLR